MQAPRLAYLLFASLALSAWAGCGKVNLHCAPGLLSCASGCVDPATDVNNCGSCGTSCGSDGVCSGGVCSCGNGTTSCADGCVDLTSDDANCGSCDHACGAGQACSNSTCACAVGFTSCGSSTSCADLTSDDANCGSCGHACTNGQTCQSSTCACPGGTALCGTSCCGAGSVCNAGTCMAPPAPNIATKWNDPTGSLDGTNIAVKMTFTPTGIPGTTYECRTGAAASFTPTTPPWGPCDGAAGTNPTYQPALPTGFDQGGSMRTEYRYRLPDPYTSPIVGYPFYLHNSLNDVISCPDPMFSPEPRQTDTAYFNFAKTFDPTNFPTTTPFPAGATLRNPFISIPFKSVTTTVGERTHGFLIDGNYMRFPAMGNLPAMFDFTVKTLSLRHKFVMSPDNTMLLMRRQYAFSTGAGGTDCRNMLWVGNKEGAIIGPNDLRGRRKIDCEALVVNVNGKGLCLAGNPIVAVPWDQQIPGNGTPGASTVSNAANSAVVTAAASAFTGLMPGNYVRITGDGTWRRVNVVNSATQITVNGAIPAAHTAVTWSFYNAVITKQFITPTGYTRLRTTRAVTNTTGRNKCTSDPGCNYQDDASTHTWYLPP